MNSLPLFPLGLWCVVQFVCLVCQDDITVVHQPSPSADQWDSGVSVAGDQGHGAPAGVNPIATTATDEGHFSVLLHADVINGVIVGGVWTHTAPADWGRVAAQWPVEALR